MRIHVTHGPSQPGWTAWEPNDAVDGLPESSETGAHVERIFVADLLSLTDRDYLPVVLESWWSHPGVTTRTLLAFTVARPDARHMYHLARPVGWGVACPYDIGLLSVDRWPVPESTVRDGLVGGICRAIKKNTTTTRTQHG